MKKYLIVCAASVLTFSCAPGSKKDVGAISGMIVGGKIANDLAPDGKHKPLATVLGAFIGGTIGQSIGEGLDEVDRMMASGAYTQALDKTPSNESVAWENPDSGNSGVIYPTKTYSLGNQPCREFTQEIIIGGKIQTGYGKACRMADGSWQLQ